MVRYSKNETHQTLKSQSNYCTISQNEHSISLNGDNEFLQKPHDFNDSTKKNNTISFPSPLEIPFILPNNTMTLKNCFYEQNKSQVFPEINSQKEIYHIINTSTEKKLLSSVISCQEKQHSLSLDEALKRLVWLKENKLNGNIEDSFSSNPSNTQRKVPFRYSPPLPPPPPPIHVDNLSSFSNNLIPTFSESCRSSFFPSINDIQESFEQRWLLR